MTAVITGHENWVGHMTSWNHDCHSFADLSLVACRNQSHDCNTQRPAAE